MEPNHYEVLGTAADASLEDVRKAYRAAVLRLHPDKAGGDGAQAAVQADAEFLRIQEAWEVLSALLLGMNETLAHEHWSLF